jgi:diadenosine tetraphosphate (Ap4A) HIT family hydrolase
MIDYSQNIVKKYNYWTVYVHTNQRYLGKCVIWCDRKDACDLVEATPEELTEFFAIIKELKLAIEKSFNPDWMNYSFLGNTDKHLHCHMVPRYKEKRVFKGKVFEDPTYKLGLNWSQDDSFITSHDILQAIKKELQRNLTLQ